MRSTAESIAATRAGAGALLLLAACADRPSLDATFAGGTIDAGSGANDAAAEAPPDVPPPGDVDPDPWTSGRRLRARVIDGGEGAKLFAFWQDPVLRFSCRFAAASDGHVRCLPVDEDLPILTTFFADPDCTKGIAIGPPPEQPYVRITDDRCGRTEDDEKPIRVVRWGNTVKVDVPYLVRSGVCSPITNGPSFNWYAIADADPQQFVLAHEQIHYAADGGGVRILTGDDGSRENSHLLDPRTGRACEVISDHVLGGPDVCVPTPFAAAPALPFFSSESCNEPIAFAEPGCDHAYAGLMLHRIDCQFGVDVMQLGPSFPTDSTGIFRKYADGICRSDMLFNPMTGYRVRQPFALQAFAATSTRSFGSGRLEARLHATSDRIAVRNSPILPLRYQLDPDSPTRALQPAPFEFWDKTLLTRCRVQEAADSTLRCVPERTVPKLGEYFEDEACTVPAHLGANDAGCPSSGYVAVPGWLEIGLNVPPPTEIRRIGAVLDKPMYMYAPFPTDPSLPPRGTCISAPMGPGRVYYALDAPIPISQLARVEDVTE
jgi:hypothetical protein